MNSSQFIFLAATAASVTAAAAAATAADDDKVAVCVHWGCRWPNFLFVCLSREHHKEGITVTLQVFLKMCTKQMSAIH